MKLPNGPIVEVLEDDILKCVRKKLEERRGSDMSKQLVEVLNETVLREHGIRRQEERDARRTGAPEDSRDAERRGDAKASGEPQRGGTRGARTQQEEAPRRLICPTL